MMKKRSLKIDRLRFYSFYIVDVFYLQSHMYMAFQRFILSLFRLAEGDLAQSIRLQNRISQFHRLYITSKVVDRLAWYTGIFSDSFDLFYSRHADFFQGNRKPYFQTEVLHFFKFFLWHSFQNQLDQCSKRNAATVVSVLDSQRCHTVVEGMCCRTVYIVCTNTGKIYIGFHDVFQRRRYSMNFAGFDRLFAVIS